MTRITRVEIIDGEGRSYVSWEDDNDIVTSIQDDGKTLKVFVNKVKPKTLFDVIRNLGYSFDAVYEIVDAIEEFEKSKEFQPTSQTNEEVEQGLKDAMRTAKEEGVFGEPEYYDELVENGVSENKQKPKTLYDILYRWWMDIFCNPIYRDWDMETSIEDLVDRIEFWNMRIKNDDDVELDEQENDKNFKNSLDLIKEWGEKNKPPTLKELLWEWWENIFTVDSDLDAETSIDKLVSIIDEKFIPPSHNTNDYQWNKCLELMRNKLR
jgi:hypothetical protein